MSTHSPASRHHASSFRRPRATRCLVDTAELGTDLGTARSREASKRFAFRATDYYAGLIDRRDEHDPIRKLIVPSECETVGFGSLDASNEADNTVVPGLQHKYPDTALLLVTDQCAGFCRYCFRKRLFVRGNRETHRDVRPALEYVTAHPEITDVLLSGGDPLTLSTSRLGRTIERLMTVPHVRTIRIGSKVPAFDPFRVTEDPGLIDLVRRIIASGRSMYLIAHFDHPRELTHAALAAIAAFRDAGAMCLNQCPITVGINDDPDVLARLFQLCTEAGCPQYYVFQCRPTTGNSAFVVPLTRALEIIETARTRVSGLSRRARFCLSHASGKIEVIGMDSRRLYARYHRAKHAEDDGRILVYRRDDTAYWLEHLSPMSDVELDRALT